MSPLVPGAPFPDSFLRSKFSYKTYTYKTNPEVSLDLYLPPSTSSKGPYKTLILFHGGGLICGGRHNMIPGDVAERLLHKDWAIISASYRLLPQATSLDILQDLKDLSTWLSTQGSALGLDTARLAVGGESAGGYVALLAAKAIGAKAVLDLFGMIDLRDPWYSGKKATPPVIGGTPTAGLSEEQFVDVFAEEVKSDDPAIPGPTGRLGLVFWALKEGMSTLPPPPRVVGLELTSAANLEGVMLDLIFGRFPRQSVPADSVVPNVPAEERELLPLEFVDATFPPLFAVHGNLDSFVPLKDSLQLAERLKALGVEAELAVIKGGEHGVFPQDGQAEAAWDRAAEFLDRVVV
ncbi:Alpha/Beta hydrolase protein [Sphaerosporella brunnea]|uniref:Alpha/Beta hydrolase protein n=1 Tax=Sphaerosporella brunnea TaxID=1250544 RepID=A0A5J5F6N1_9PEZI|nr:Alpha/Beta hydrolase protein [Sphaerosporella brunnea]